MIYFKGLEIKVREPWALSAILANLHIMMRS